MTQDEYFKAANKAGQYTSAASGAVSLLGQFTNMINTPTMNTQAPAQQQDVYGKPQYNLGQMAAEVASFKPPKTTGGEIGSAALTGAGAGAAFGPIGAGVGAVIGAGGALLAGRRRRKKAERAQRLAQGNLQAAQQLYNKAVEGYSMTEIGKAQYNNAVNTQSRMNNLYAYNTQY